MELEDTTTKGKRERMDLDQYRTSLTSSDGTTLRINERSSMPSGPFSWQQSRNIEQCAGCSKVCKQTGDLFIMTRALTLCRTCADKNWHCEACWKQGSPWRGDLIWDHALWVCSTCWEDLEGELADDAESDGEFDLAEARARNFLSACEDIDDSQEEEEEEDEIWSRYKDPHKGWRGEWID